MTTVTQQYLSLTADEILVITDRVRNDAVGVEPHGLSAFPLLLKLASAYLDAFGDGTKRAGEIPVSVSEAEVWLVRSLISSGDKSPADVLFGVNLLCKIYRALLAFNPLMDVPEAGGIDDEFTDDRKNALKRYIGG